MNNINIEDLIVIAEGVDDGKEYVGYVCGCDECSKPYDSFEGDLTRPQGMLTSKDCKWGNIKVFTDTMRFLKFEKENYGVEYQLKMKQYLDTL